MKLEYVILADAAQVVEGKLYLLGGAWSVLRCPAFPYPVTASVVVSILIDREESSTRQPLLITISQPDGVPLVPPINGEFQIGVSDDVPQTRGLFPIQMNFQVPQPGRYAVTVESGEQVVSVFFDALFIGKRLEIVAPPMRAPLASIPKRKK